MVKKNRSLKKYLFIIIPIIIISIGIGAFAFFQESKQEVVRDKMVVILGDSPILGEPTAPLTLVEWGDYQCSFCYQFYTDTKDSIFSNFVDSGKIRFIYKDFPAIGSASVLAAEASYCADDQNKYWAYHDELYKNWEGENAEWINLYNLKKFAYNVGLDIDVFDKCVQNEKHKQKVLDNYSYAQSIGVKGTPIFAILDKEANILKVIRGAQPYDVFYQVLSEKLRTINT